MKALGEGCVGGNVLEDKVEGVPNPVVHWGFGSADTLEEVVAVNVDGFPAFARAWLGDGEP